MAVALKLNQHLYYCGSKAVLTRVNKKRKSVILSMEDELCEIPLEEFYKLHDCGDIEPYENNQLAVPWTGVLTKKQLAELEKYRAYLTDWIEQDDPKSRSKAKRHIEEVAKKHGYTGDNIPSDSTLFSWYDKLEEAHWKFEGLLIQSSRNCAKRVHPDYVDFFYKLLDKHHLINKAEESWWSRKKVIDEFKIEAEKITTELNKVITDGTKKFKAPGKTALNNWYNEIDPFEICQAHYGFAEARKRFRSKKGFFNIAVRPLERVQIDAVHINVGLINDDSQYIGMPVVYFAIDVFTRAILGYVITYAKQRREDISSAVHLIQTCLQYKPQPDHTQYGWPLWGLIECIQHDSGVFSSKEFKEYLANLMIDFIQNPAKTPWVNCYIERFNRTFREHCCTLIPGYLGSRLDINTGKSIEAVAYTTAVNFQKITEAFILDYYHQRPHRGLDNRTPAQMCERYGGSVELPSPEYIERIKLFHGKKMEGAIQDLVGIEKNGIHYCNDQLMELRRKLTRKSGGLSPRADYYYSQLDISKVSVMDPRTGELFLVHATSIHDSISLQEYKSYLEDVAIDPKTVVLPTSMMAVVADIEKDKAAIEAEKAKKKREKAQNKKNKKEQEERTFENGIDDVFNENTAGFGYPDMEAEPSSNSSSVEILPEHSFKKMDI